MTATTALYCVPRRCGLLRAPHSDTHFAHYAAVQYVGRRQKLCNRSDLAWIGPVLVVALRGSSFGRVAYSPRWYRDPDGAVSAMPGWMALAITLGCAAAIYRLWQIRSPREPATPEPTSCAIGAADGSRAGRKTGTVSVTAGA
ncbi:hypothetical protein ACFYUD_33690 [Nocardia tengchongensis]|uniref:hypothetical protein n=1 Tax=Nocardia tengchongensis TaxID=2055889 RepID=UPI0036B44C6D